MKASLLFVFLALSTSTLLSQSIPVFNTFLFDKYSLNPSYVADNGFSQVNLIHKRLWAGIDDSPVISGLNIQYPYSDKIGFAISFLNDRRILLSNNTAFSTLSYRLCISKYHQIQFGISGGVRFRQFESDDIEDVIDPALNNLATNSTSFQSQFGISYSYRSFGIGFALPQLIKERNIHDNKAIFQVFDRFSGNIYYNYEATLNLDIETYALFVRDANLSDFVEIGVLGKVSNSFAIGTFYREARGLGLIVKSSFKKLDFAYAYEDGSAQNLSFTGSTHELQVKFNLDERVKRTNQSISKYKHNSSYRKRKKRITKKRRSKSLRKVRKPRY
ncbi:MAG: PorP/SprF family type IX secretion system membrane protein [Fulvivirga sp.]